MILKNNVLLEVNSNKIVSNSLYKNKEERKIYDFCLKDLKELKTNIDNKNLYIFIEGKEVYIKFLELPKVKKRKLRELIKRELIYYFYDISNIMFDYTILKENKSFLEIIVFCLNWDKNYILKNCIYGTNLRFIYLIQFCLLNYYKEKIKSYNFLFLFVYNNNLYFLACKNTKLICNKVVKNTNSYEKFKEYFEKFIIKILDIDKNFKFEKIYLLNFNNKNFIGKIFQHYICENLGFIKIEDILKYYTKRYRRNLWIN